MIFFFLLPDDDDFVAESSDEAVLMNQCIFVRKRSEKWLFTKLSPYSTWLAFVAMAMPHSIKKKQTLECILPTCKVLSQSIHRQTHSASLNVTTLFVDKLLKAASSQHCCNTQAL